MKYFLWINEKQEGPFMSAELHAMLNDGKIKGDTLGRPEDDTGEWRPIKNFSGALDPAKPPSAVTPISLKKIEESRVASALTVIAVLELIGAPIAGLIEGSDNTLVGWLVFVSGVISGLILLGFARVIGHLCESTQRLQRIEALIWNANAEK